MTEKIKLLPYGSSDYIDIIRSNNYYIDKTMHILELEKSRFNFFIRPRRFGKSLLVSMLKTYYDILYKENFENYFKDTYIYKNPTEYKNSYMVLYFNFSCVVKNHKKVQEDFDEYCRGVILKFLRDYESLLRKEVINKVKEKNNSNAMLYTLAIELQNHSPKMYIIIDEYDNFTNTILANYGHSHYMKIAKDDGYFKQFFTSLKSLTSGTDTPLQRIFITGVSPVTLDDVTSGFNIGTNISTENCFNNMLGFTRSEVETILNYYIDSGELPLDKNVTLEILENWYGGYLFHKDAQETIYNTNGVIYLIQSAIRAKNIPENLIDHNLRMDYSKIQNLIFIDRKLNGNFKTLSNMVTTGKTSFTLAESFPQNAIAEQENFQSLLYFLGLITFSGETYKAKPLFTIPNNSIKLMVFEYIRRAIEKSGEYSMNMANIHQVMADMGFDGNYKDAMHALAEMMQQNTSVRDLVGEEKVVQMFFLTCFMMSDLFIAKSEPPYGGGYADIALIPFLAKYPDMEYAYLIEFKYIKSNVSLKQYKIEEKEALKNATLQLEKYSKSLQLEKEITKIPGTTAKLKKLIVIFQGAELKYLAQL